MKQLIFPLENYDYQEPCTFIYKKTEDSNIGKLELLWTIIQQTQISNKNRDEIKAYKHLKSKIKEVTKFKDCDKDSRVSIHGKQQLLLESSEYKLLKRFLDEVLPNLNTLYIEDFDHLLEIVDGAEDYRPPKPMLVDDAAN